MYYQELADNDGRPIPRWAVSLEDLLEQFLVVVIVTAEWLDEAL